MREISAKDLDQKIRAGSSLVLVIFTANWSSVNEVCQQILLGAANEYRGRLLVYRIDADQNPELQEKLRIRGIPTFLFYRDGVELERLSGSHPRAVFHSAIERNLAPIVPLVE
jgi:thioredoxin 1